MRNGISEPKLFDYAGDLSKAWYVGFSMTRPANPGSFRNDLPRKRFQIREFINLEHKAADRRAAGHNLLRSVKKALSDGWNPFECPFSDWFMISKLQDPKPREMEFIDALKYGLAQKKGFVARQTFTTYENHIKYGELAAKSLGLTHKLISEVKRVDGKNLLRQIQKDRGWSAHAYNKGLDFFSSLISILVEDDLIEINPFFKIKRQEWAEVNSHIPPTDQQQKLIKAHLFKKHYHFFVFCIAIYHTGIRPKELLGLRIGDLDSRKRTFTLVPGDERTKTNKKRVVPINPHLWTHINKMDLWKYPSDWHIFSIKFKPGERRIKRNVATRTWKNMVKDPKSGLGIDVNMYALKHKGADDKILAGIDLDALKELYGHSSKFMTEKYARAVKQVYRNQINDKSPDF